MNSFQQQMAETDIQFYFSFWHGISHKYWSLHHAITLEVDRTSKQHSSGLAIP